MSQDQTQATKLRETIRRQKAEAQAERIAGQARIAENEEELAKLTA